MYNVCTLITYTNGQKMANKTLDIELVSLQKNAIEGAVHFENSKKILYRNLAQTYMFWRKANMQSGYLEDCYKKKGIRFNNVGNKPNFNALRLHHLV